MSFFNALSTTDKLHSPPSFWQVGRNVNTCPSNKTERTVALNYHHVRINISGLLWYWRKRKNAVFLRHHIEASFFYVFWAALWRFFAADIEVNDIFLKLSHYNYVYDVCVFRFDRIMTLRGTTNLICCNQASLSCAAAAVDHVGELQIARTNYDNYLPVVFKTLCTRPFHLDIFCLTPSVPRSLKNSKIWVNWPFNVWIRGVRV